MFINGSNPRKIPITCLPPFNFTKKKDKFHELHINIFAVLLLQ